VLGIVEEEGEDEYTRKAMTNGTNVEPIAKYEYTKTFCDADDVIDDEPFYRRHDIGASPDLVVHRKRCVEIKCVDGRRDSTDAFDVSYNHVLQLAAQLYCTGLAEGHLYYYRSIDSRWACYRVRLDSAATFDSLVRPWIDEAFASGAARMKRGEADRRRALIKKMFFD
jgi:hypothetical protein